jgi:hypothetical protein
MANVLIWCVVSPDNIGRRHSQGFQVAWWNYLGVTNIISEGGIIAQALLVIIRVQADIHKKIVLSSVFLFRVVYVAHNFVGFSIIQADGIYKAW